jgi:Protein of unknown function (DUF2380)
LEKAVKKGGEYTVAIETASVPEIRAQRRMNTNLLVKLNYPVAMGTSPIVLEAPLRLACTALLCAALWICHAQAHGAELKTIAILDFDLVDDQHELSPATVEYPRLRAIRDQLQEEFAASRLYRVVDLGPASEIIRKYQAEMQLHACNGCELDIARALHADRVLIGWVQKVSNLILNINIQIEDAATGTILLNKSVDLRGNTDETWRRGVSFLVKSMVEKGQGNR